MKQRYGKETQMHECYRCIIDEFSRRSAHQIRSKVQHRPTVSLLINHLSTYSLNFSMSGRDCFICRQARNVYIVWNNSCLRRWWIIGITQLQIFHTNFCLILFCQFLDQDDKSLVFIFKIFYC